MRPTEQSATGSQKRSGAAVSSAGWAGRYEGTSGVADKKLDRLREKAQLMPVLKSAQTAQRQLNTFVVIPMDISVEFLNKIIQRNTIP